MKQEPIVFADSYFRYQEDHQSFFSRSETQKKIVDEYFIVRNQIHKHSHPWASIVGRIAIVIGIILAVALGCLVGITMAAIGVFVVVVGIGLRIFWKKTRKVLVEPGKVLTPSEYDAYVTDKTISLDLPQLSLNALGVTAEAMKAITPMVFSDNAYAEWSMYVYHNDIDKLSSSTQAVTYLYCTMDRILAYRVQFDMCCGNFEQTTSEIFYKDICDIATERNSEVCMLNGIKAEKNTLVVSIVTNFTSFDFEVGNTDENRAALERFRQALNSERIG